MESYLVNPVLDEIKSGIVNMFDRHDINAKQAVELLVMIEDSVERFNSRNSSRLACRCGKCLKSFSIDEKMYSLKEEIEKLTGGFWWSEELDKSVAFDTVCKSCLDNIEHKYFCL
ncbi:MAG: hypothetical protein IJ682_06415 [Lachnospiraceae bacterium]|nr:hypothetical protein [Lachnospiraceae bacterium]